MAWACNVALGCQPRETLSQKPNRKMNEAQTAPFDESPFWRFSLRFYARSKVSAACLALQDDASVDVNLLLFLLFLAEHHRSVNAGDIARLDTRISAWREQVVKRLRELRR